MIEHVLVVSTKPDRFVHVHLTLNNLCKKKTNPNRFSISNKKKLTIEPFWVVSQCSFKVGLFLSRREIVNIRPKYHGVSFCEFCICTWILLFKIKEKVKDFFEGISIQFVFSVVSHEKLKSRDFLFTLYIRCSSWFYVYLKQAQCAHKQNNFF